MNLINKLFFFLNRSKIEKWENVHNMSSIIEITIDSYKKTTMSEYEVNIIKYHLAEIESILN